MKTHHTCHNLCRNRQLLLENLKRKFYMQKDVVSIFLDNNIVIEVGKYLVLVTFKQLLLEYQTSMLGTEDKAVYDSSSVTRKCNASWRIIIRYLS